MKTKLLCLLPVAFVFAACDAQVNVPPSNTTVVQPAEKKETNTTIVNPPAEKKTETTTVTTPGGTTTQKTETKQ